MPHWRDGTSSFSRVLYRPGICSCTGSLQFPDRVVLLHTKMAESGDGASTTSYDRVDDSGLSAISGDVGPPAGGALAAGAAGPGAPSTNPTLPTGRPTHAAAVPGAEQAGQRAYDNIATSSVTFGGAGSTAEQPPARPPVLAADSSSYDSVATSSVTLGGDQGVGTSTAHASAEQPPLDPPAPAPLLAADSSSYDSIYTSSTTASGTSGPATVVQIRPSAAPDRPSGRPPASAVQNGSQVRSAAQQEVGPGSSSSLSLDERIRGHIARAKVSGPNVRQRTAVALNHILSSLEQVKQVVTTRQMAYFPSSAEKLAKILQKIETLHLDVSDWLVRRSVGRSVAVCWGGRRGGTVRSC